MKYPSGNVSLTVTPCLGGSPESTEPSIVFPFTLYVTL